MKIVFSIGVLWLMVVMNTFAAPPEPQFKAQLLNSQMPARYQLQMSVPRDHHAYLDKGDEGLYIPVTLNSDNQLATQNMQLNHLQLPQGHYDAEVKANVLRGNGDFSFELNAVDASLTLPTNLALAVKYQICNDVTHQCFRPQTVRVPLDLPIQTPLKNQTPVQEDKRLSEQLLAMFKNHQGNVMMMFTLMFVAGLLSVATPCVYPMLPITSMFIVGRAGGLANKEMQHALFYVLGIVCTYLGLGLIAGLTGGAFNVFMQSGWVNLAFALFFAFFAISLLGYYELALMQNEVHSLDEKTARVGGLVGTWLMGGVAGLVISPCVGPIVFALLLQVADNMAQKTQALAALNQAMTFGDQLVIALQGSVMMGGFGLGVGLPFFIISVVKFKKLPKAGYWMNKIKYTFGLVILYFAYSYLEKALGVFGALSQTGLILACSILLVWFAIMECRVLCLLPADANTHHQFRQFMGILSLLLGGTLLVMAMQQLPFFPKTTTQYAALTTQSTNEDIEMEAGISWYRQFNAAQKQAQATGKPIFIDFYASWCANCIAFKEETKHNKALNETLREKAVTLKLVDKEADFELFKENPAHRPLKIGLPYFAIINADSRVIWSGTDFQATQEMIDVLTNNHG